MRLLGVVKPLGAHGRRREPLNVRRSPIPPLDGALVSAPCQTDDMWILDLDGERQVIVVLNRSSIARVRRALTLACPSPAPSGKSWPPPGDPFPQAAPLLFFNSPPPP